MALRIGTTLYNHIYSLAEFAQDGATIVGLAKRVTDAGADQAICVVNRPDGGRRHEIQFNAADEIVGRVEWYSETTPVLATAPAGWFWFAIVLYRESGAPRLKFFYKPHLSGSVVSAILTDGGAQAAVGSPITNYQFFLGAGVDPWVSEGGCDYAYIKTWQAALSDAEISAEMGAFAQVRTANEHSYLTLISKASVAAAVVDESGESNDWLVRGAPTLNDAANPGAFGGTQPTVAISAATAFGQGITGSGTFTSAAGSPAISVQLLAGATGTTQGPVAATSDGSNWSVAFSSVPVGVYTMRVTITDANGTVLATSSTLEMVGLSGSGELPHLYSVGSIVMTPEAASVSVAGTQVLTIVDGNGLPLDGVVVTSTAPAVATVTSPSSALGQVTVTGVSAGAATIQASFSDVSAGTLSDSTSISVALLTPSAPTNLVATALGPTSVRLTYQDTSANETQFRVERALAAAGPWVQILTPGEGVVSVDDTTVVAGTTYFYRVRAANNDGASVPSNVASVSVPVAPDTEAPAVVLSASSQTVSVANSTIRIRANATDNRGVTEVRFYRNGTQIGGMLTAPNDGTLYAIDQSFASQAENGTIQYTARAWDAAGNSTVSSPLAVLVNIAAITVAPLAPSGLLISAVTASSMRLTWTVNSLDETAILLERRVGASGAWGQVASLAAGTALYDATGLLATTQYSWRVRAQGTQAASGYSNEATQTTLAPAATGLTLITASTSVASGVSGTTATITYTALNGNGSSRPGVTITPSVSNPGVASVAPVNGVTDASGTVSFVVTFGDTVSQADLLIGASDGQSTIAPSAAPKVQLFSIPTITTALVKEFQVEQQDPKYAEEITPIVWDYSAYLGRGELPVAIVLREAIPTAGQDRDPNSAAMLFGEGIIVGDRVLQWVRDGVPGVSYFLRCRVRTSNGRVAVAEVRMRIYRAPGARVSSSSPVIE